MRLEDYFRRTGYRGPMRPTRETLSALLKAHVCAVPFEALDVQLGRPLGTDAASAYDKIVERGRGGWCYEQNGLFGWALAELGFRVTRVAAAVNRHKRGPAADANHLCLLVSVADEPERQYVADVGFGGSMVEPVELAAVECRQPPFRLGFRPLDNDRWRFWENAGDGEFSFDFAPVPADEDAMAARCQALQTDPESSFVQNLVAQRRLEDAHLALRGRVLKRIGPSGTTTQLLDSAAELVETLQRHFDLDVPEIAAVWPSVCARHEALFGSDP